MLGIIRIMNSSLNKFIWFIVTNDEKEFEKKKGYTIHSYNRRI